MSHWCRAALETEPTNLFAAVRERGTMPTRLELADGSIQSTFTNARYFSLCSGDSALRALHGVCNLTRLAQESVSFC